MRGVVHYIPIATTVAAAIFAVAIWRHHQARRSGPHLLWWTAGIVAYGAGTATESAVTLFGWNIVVFKLWYVTGALLGGAPLAQGTVYLLLSRRVAHLLTAILVPTVVVAAAAVAMSPVNHALVESYRLTGAVMEWTWVRWFSPFINTYAFIFLVGGAAYSAVRYSVRPDASHRAIGNALIAFGALLPGIGGMSTRMGYTEVLYVTEFVGLCFIWLGYRWIVREGAPLGAFSFGT